MKKVTPGHVGVALSLAVAFHTTVLTLSPLHILPEERSTVDALHIHLTEDLVRVPEDNDEPAPAPDSAEAREIPQNTAQVKEEPVAEKEPTEAPKATGELREPEPQAGSTKPPKEILEQSADRVDPREYEVPEQVPAPTLSEAERTETKLPLSTPETLPTQVAPNEHSDNPAEGGGRTNLQKSGGGESLASAEVVRSVKTPNLQPNESIQKGAKEVSDLSNITPVVQSPSQNPASESASADSSKTGVNDGSRETDRASSQGTDQSVSPEGTVAGQDRTESYEVDQEYMVREETSRSGGANPLLEQLGLGAQSGEEAAGKPVGIGIEAYEFVWAGAVTPERDISVHIADDPEAPMPKAAPLEEEGDWYRECEDENSPETCQIVQEVHLQKNVEAQNRNLGRILKVSVSRASKSSGADGGLYITIYLPLGVDLRPGAVIKVNQGADIPLRYLKCTAAGCRVDVPIDGPLLNAMGAGGQLFVGFLPWGGTKTNIIPTSLKGFSRALASLP